MENNKKSISKDILIIFILTVIPKFILIFYSYPFNIIGDEIWTLSSAAKLAGFDWSGILTGGRYYGMGFFSLFFPLFKTIDNPIILYRTLLGICVIANFFIALIAYYMLKNFTHIKEHLSHILLSVTASYIVILPITYIYNEHIYVLIVWIVVYLLLLINVNHSNKKKKFLYTLLLLSVLTYSMLIHSRAVTLWIAVIGVIILYYISYRKWLVDWKFFSIIGISSYLIINVIVEKQIKWLWTISLDNLSNTSVYGGGLNNIFKPEYWQSFFSIILGQIFTGDIFTGGLLVFLLILAIIMIFKALFSRRQKQCDASIFIVFCFTVICIIITICGQSVNWLPGVKDAISERKIVADAYRGITYLRYYMAYAGPFLLLGIIYIKENWLEYRKFTTYTMLAKFSLYGVWIIFIFPYIIYSNSAASSFRPFAFQPTYDITSGIRTYFPAIGIAIILFSILLFSLYKKQYKISIIIFSAFFIYKYMYSGIMILNTEQENFQSVDGIVEIMENHKNTKNKIDTIYVYGNQTLTEEIQWLFKNSIVINDTVDSNEFIIFSDSAEAFNEIIDSDTYYIEIDSNEYMCIKGDNNIEIMKELDLI